MGTVNLGDERRDPATHKLSVWARAKKRYVADLVWLAAYLRRQTPEECRMRFITKPIRTNPNKKAKGSKKNKK